MATETKVEDRPDIGALRKFARAERMARYFSGPPAPNIWLGASVENADHTFRIEDLRKARAQIKFLSLEPLLGPLTALNLHGIDWVIIGGESGLGARPCDVRWIENIVEQCREAGVPVFVKQLGARPYEGHDERDGCCPRGQKHPGKHPLGRCSPVGLLPRRIQSPKGGDMAEWPEHLRVREFPGDKENEV